MPLAARAPRDRATRCDAIPSAPTMIARPPTPCSTPPAWATSPSRSTASPSSSRCCTRATATACCCMAACRAACSRRWPRASSAASPSPTSTDWCWRVPSSTTRSTTARWWPSAARSPSTTRPKRPRRWCAWSRPSCLAAVRDARAADRQELAATVVLGLPIADLSLKSRSGGPSDAPEDLGLPVWSGVIPLALTAARPVAAADLDPAIPLPGYLARD